MEKWDLYTKYREKTGEEMIRGERMPEGRYHLTVDVWIRNSRGQYLISQRAANRPSYPLLWECVGGSAVKGESSLEGALREVKEEVGLDLKEEDGRLLFTKIRGQEYRYRGKAYNDIKDKKLVQSLDYFFCAMEAGRPDYGEIIGRRVRGTVDRPMGTAHPRHPEMIYPLNYGYVDGVFAGDGGEQDVYLFGTDRPLERFEGRVIAVYHRFDDVEDKWIVSLDGEDVPDERILGEISFQEQFFCGKLYR